MNGLMIESHIRPDAALSDAGQQLPPDELADLLDSLQFRTGDPANGGSGVLLEVMRQQIDFIDHELLEVISRRASLVDRIGHFKKTHNMTILQVRRWEQLLEDRLKRAKLIGLDEQFVREFYQIIHQHSIRIQSAIMNKQLEASKAS